MDLISTAFNSCLNYSLSLSELEKKISKYGENFPKFYHYNVIQQIIYMYWLK